MNLYEPVTSKDTQASTTNRLLSHSHPPSFYSSVSATTFPTNTYSTSSTTTSSITSSIETPQHQSALSAVMQPISRATTGISTQLEQSNSSASETNLNAAHSFPTFDPSFLQFLDKGPPEETTRTPNRPFSESNTKEISPPRMNLNQVSTDFTTSVFSRLSYVLGENAESLGEERSVASQPVITQEPDSDSYGIIRVERDYSLGELCRFSLVYPSELSAKIAPESFRRSITTMNEILHKAESSWVRNSFDNILSCLTLYTSPYCFGTFYQKCMKELDQVIAQENTNLYLPAGFHLRDPRRTGFLFLEIEVIEQ